MSQINSNNKDDFQVFLLLPCFVGHPVASGTNINKTLSEQFTQKEKEGKRRRKKEKEGKIEGKKEKERARRRQKEIEGERRKNTEKERE